MFMPNLHTESKETHYTILGVSDKASSDEIKKAYRKLSLELHPDRNHNDHIKAEKYKKVSAAYSILSNEAEKTSYDASLQFGDLTNNLDPNLFMNMMLNPIDIQTVLKDLQNLRGKGTSGFHIPTDSFKTFAFGSPFSFKPQNYGNINDYEFDSKPTTISASISITFLEAYKGLKYPLSITRWVFEDNKRLEQHETIYVDIPQGIDNNEIITIENKGNKLSSNNKGDIEVKIKITNDTAFERNGIDLIFKKSITLKESLCGFSFDLPYIDGREFKINNEIGNIIPPDFHKTIPNLGMTRDSSTGDIIIIFDVIYPKKLSNKQLTQLSEIL
jgi:DnaJ-class molecular chaperone